MKKITLSILSFYQKHISPGFVNTFGHSCRFSPTCSVYTYQAIEKYGIVNGGMMATKRLLRCNPFSHGGYDPVK
jgi:putative membrane protein insertion efficiency factor